LKDPESPGCFAPAQSFNVHRSTHLPEQFRAFHPPRLSPPQDEEYRAMKFYSDATNYWVAAREGIITPAFSAYSDPSR
jgi:hypothetical protein